MRSALVRFVGVVVLAASTVVVEPSSAAVSVAEADCAPVDTEVTSPYPVAGYWVFGRSSDCAWRDVLQRIHRVGGNMVIQFGPKFSGRQVSPAGVVQAADGSGDDPSYAPCVQGTLTCYQAAVRDVRAANAANSIARVFVYSAPEVFGAALQVCRSGGFDADLVTVGGVTFARLLLDRTVPTDRSCDFTRGRAYDLVLVRTTGYDSVAGLLREATAFGMAAYLGLPAGPGVPGAGWDVDRSAVPAFAEFNRRVLADYARRHGSSPAFAGVYQTFETPLTGPIGSAVELYRTQHAQVRALLPGKRVLLSPYLDARKTNANGRPPSAVRDGLREIVQGDVDIIAPQDSRGTGKVGLFWPYQATAELDPRVAPVVHPATTNGAAYYGSTADYLREARQTIDTERLDVELWVNVEAFEPTPPESGRQCGDLTTRQRTDKARLDHAVTMAGSYGSQLIAFMWDPLFVCLAGENSTLADEIAGSFNRPILSGAFRFASGGRDGVVVRGFRFSAAVVSLTWYDATWQPRGGTIRVSDSGWYNPDIGADSPRLPDRTEEVWVPFDWTAVAPHFWLHINVTNGAGGSATHRYSLGY